MCSHENKNVKCDKLNTIDQTDVPNKYKLITKIEDILSYLLSRKHNASVKITFKKESHIDGDTN